MRDGFAVVFLVPRPQLPARRSRVEISRDANARQAPRAETDNNVPDTVLLGRDPHLLEPRYQVRPPLGHEARDGRRARAGAYGLTLPTLERSVAWIATEEGVKIAPVKLVVAQGMG